MSDIQGQILGINHLGIAAKDPEKARWFFGEVLQLNFLGDELVAEQQTLTSMFVSEPHLRQKHAPRIELLEHHGDQPGPISKFIQNRGGGIHHIALTVRDLTRVVSHLRNLGIEFINDQPRSGAHNTRVVFIHPRSTGGVLTELVEDPGML